MELSRLLGRAVVDGDGSPVGRVADLTVRLDATYPAATGLVVRGVGRAFVWAPWADVQELDEERITLRAAGRPGGAVPEGGLLLRRDVLDTQVYDVAGKRFARVGDVRLARHDDELVVVGVEVGAGTVLRRLGLGRLRRRPQEAPIDWAEVRLVSVHGHALQLSAGAPERRLAPADLAELLARLPAERGADLLARLPPREAAAALSHSRPRVGGRLVGAVAPALAASILTEMPRDDATSALRHLSHRELDQLLGRLGSERAAELRRLLAHPAGTAAGLMNPEVVTVQRGAGPDEIRRAVTEAAPRLDALLTVFVVEGDRLVGAIPPRALLTGGAEPVPGPTIHPEAPVADVVDLFALHDLLAVPVVDAEGRLLGAVAVDDILEELLAERMPGRRRYLTIRSRRR